MTEREELAEMIRRELFNYARKQDVRIGDGLCLLPEHLADAILAKWGWQPIETVPKDRNREVLLYDESMGMAVHPFGVHPSWDGVTHWRPLPEPPA